jgi:hypothetical protein
MLTDNELRTQQTVIAIKRRLLKSGRLHRNQLRYSCMWATETEFQEILDALVAEGIATREAGTRGGEYYRSVVPKELQ